MKNNLQLADIKRVEDELNLPLTTEQRQQVLNEYSRVVVDSADNWSTIVEDLIYQILN